jgi:hypothetical protein
MELFCWFQLSAIFLSTLFGWLKDGNEVAEGKGCFEDIALYDSLVYYIYQNHPSMSTLGHTEMNNFNGSFNCFMSNLVQCSFSCEIVFAIIQNGEVTMQYMLDRTVSV